MSISSQFSSSTLVMWFPGEVVINYTSAPVKRPTSVAHGQWWNIAHKQMLEQREGFTDQYPIPKAGLKIVFVGEHKGLIANLVQTAVRLLQSYNTGFPSTVKGENMQDYPALEILREPAGELGTGLRIEITP